METSRLTLSHVIPDLLFADLPPEMLFRTKVSSPNHFLMSLEEHFYGGVAPPPSEATGMFVQAYYSFDDADICIKKPAGALKAVSGYVLACSKFITHYLLSVLYVVLSPILSLFTTSGLDKATKVTIPSPGGPCGGSILSSFPGPGGRPLWYSESMDEEAETSNGQS